MKNKKELIDQILEIELEMFLNVPSTEKSSCQESPDGFRLHRRAQFSVWSEETLKSYLDDLNQARAEDINIMTLKYAYMDNLIPEKENFPIIDEIVSLQYTWQQEIIKKYPNLMAGARPLTRANDSDYKISFETYLRGELKIYSENTLYLLYKDMKHMSANSINMSEKIYENLVKNIGYNSIEDADQAQKGGTVK